MRHRNRGRKLGVSPSHRKAMGRNMIQALIDHERIVTTVEKAKQFQPLAERIIHLGKEKTLHNIRRAEQLLGNRGLQNPVVSTETVGEGKEAETKHKQVAGTTLQKLFNDVGPRNRERNGGYTRIVKRGVRRLGDNASQCIFELVESPYTKIEE